MKSSSQRRLVSLSLLFVWLAGLPLRAINDSSGLVCFLSGPFSWIHVQAWCVPWLANVPLGIAMLNLGRGRPGIPASWARLALALAGTAFLMPSIVVRGDGLVAPARFYEGFYVWLSALALLWLWTERDEPTEWPAWPKAA